MVEFVFGFVCGTCCVVVLFVFLGWLVNRFDGGSHG